MLTSEVNAKGFTVPFRLIVTGAGPGAGDVATIGFRRGDAVPGGIAVYLAAGIVQDSFDRLALLFLRQAVVEQEAQTVDVGVHRFDGELAVVSRRSDRSSMDQVFNVAQRCRQRLSDIMFQQSKIRVLLQCHQPTGHTANEVVEDGDQDGRLSSVGTIPMKGALDEIVAEEAGAARDKHAATRQAV